MAFGEWRAAAVADDDALERNFKAAWRRSCSPSQASGHVRARTAGNRNPADPAFLLSVNLSGSQLAHPDLLNTVSRALDGSGLKPANLGLELTEQVLIGDVDDVLRTLSALKELGVTLLLDEFGTGFSSLSHLKRFPIDIVKIDRSFIEGLDDPAGGSDDAAIVAALVSMCRATGKRIVPEGVETDTQVRVLQRLGCRFGQGYHFSRPMKSCDFDAWFAQANG